LIQIRKQGRAVPGLHAEVFLPEMGVRRTAGLVSTFRMELRTVVLKVIGGRTYAMEVIEPNGATIAGKRCTIVVPAQGTGLFKVALVRNI